MQSQSESKSISTVGAAMSIGRILCKICNVRTVLAKYNKPIRAALFSQRNTTVSVLSYHVARRGRKSKNTKSTYPFNPVRGR